MTGNTRCIPWAVGRSNDEGGADSSATFSDSQGTCTTKAKRSSTAFALSDPTQTKAKGGGGARVNASCISRVIGRLNAGGVAGSSTAFSDSQNTYRTEPKRSSMTFALNTPVQTVAKGGGGAGVNTSSMSQGVGRPNDGGVTDSSAAFSDRQDIYTTNTKRSSTTFALSAPAQTVAKGVVGAGANTSSMSGVVRVRNVAGGSMLKAKVT